MDDVVLDECLEADVVSVHVKVCMSRVCEARDWLAIGLRGINSLAAFRPLLFIQSSKFTDSEKLIRRKPWLVPLWVSLLLNPLSNDSMCPPLLLCFQNWTSSSLCPRSSSRDQNIAQVPQCFEKLFPMVHDWRRACPASLSKTKNLCRLLDLLKSS